MIGPLGWQCLHFRSARPRAKVDCDKAQKTLGEMSFRRREGSVHWRDDSGISVVRRDKFPPRILCRDVLCCVVTEPGRIMGAPRPARILRTCNATPTARLPLKATHMTVTLYQSSVPVFQKMLGNLKTILQKGETYAQTKKIEPAVLLGARLQLNMYTLTKQVQIATDVAKGACARLAGQEIPKYDDNEITFADVYARIDKTLAYLATFKAAVIDGQEDRDITILPGGKEMHFKGQDYLLHWALPNFYFHVMTSYAILRHHGVDVGKMDYLGSF
jgi:uncharacterized protein